jgi:hypothetical protein
MREYMADCQKGRPSASRIDEKFKDMIIPIANGLPQATKGPHYREGKRRLIKRRLALLV